MGEEHTTAAVQRYLDDLAGVKGDSPVEPIVRDLLARSVNRLHLLCATLLFRSYPRLTRPPLNLQADEMLSSVVERLLKALKGVRPPTVRQFFALANQHMRWELNDLARRLDKEEAAVELQSAVPARQRHGSQLPPNTRRILDAIEECPKRARSVQLVRIQVLRSRGRRHLGVSPKTVQRRLDRGVMLLSRLGDLQPAPPGSA